MPQLPPYDESAAFAMMSRALTIAREALAAHEVPVGCIIVDSTGREIASAHDWRQSRADPMAHAEILALRHAAQILGDWRLDGMTMYVTLEPCPMCAGAILMARIGRVVFGADSPKWGTAGSRADWLGQKVFPHKPEVIGGVQAETCGALLSDYFQQFRAQQ